MLITNATPSGINCIYLTSVGDGGVHLTLLGATMIYLTPARLQYRSTPGSVEVTPVLVLQFVCVFLLFVLDVLVDFVLFPHKNSFYFI